MTTPTVQAATPKPTDPVHALLMRVIERIAPSVVKSSGIDKARWRLVLERYMSRFQPTVDLAITRNARSAVYAGVIDEYIRKSKRPAVENLRDLDEIKRAIKHQDRLVHLRRDDGQYVAKREKDCTALELEALADRHHQYAQGHTRREGYYRELARQMRLKGFDEAVDPLSRLLGS